MYLMRAIYVSTITNRQDSAALQDIMRTAQPNNEKHNLTGMLVFSSKYYLQVVEGGRQEVNQLLGNLYRDARHTDMQMLGLEEITQRAFPEWSMRFVPVESATQQILLRNGTGREFQPYALSYGSALGLMLDMQALAQA